MESTSTRQHEIVTNILMNIKEAILNLNEWNKDISDADAWLMSSDGMRTLAANCMLIEAIGEGIKQIDKRTDGKLLPLRPEIPWKLVKGMRDHIAHGYFDINNNFVYDVIKNDLPPLLDAIEYFIEHH